MNLGAPLQFLIVDDDHFVRTVARDVLEHLGCDVEVFCDGVEAVAWAASNRFDAAIVDHVMPGLDGLGVCRHLHRLEPTARLILCTAYRTDEIADDLARVPLTVLRKPFDVDQLDGVVQVVEIFCRGLACRPPERPSWPGR